MLTATELPEPSVSLTGGGGIVEPFRKRSETMPGAWEPDPLLDAVGELLDQTKTTAELLLSRAKAIKANEMETPIARERRCRAENFSVVDRVAPRYDSMRKAILTEIAGIEALTTPKPASGLNEVSLGVEIRANLKALNADARRKLLNNEGSDELAKALHGYPSFLSGMTDAERNAYLAGWRTKRFPAEVNRQARLAGALDMLERTSGVLLRYADSLTDKTAIERAEALERRAREAA